MKTPQINIVSITKSENKPGINICLSQEHINCSNYIKYNKQEQYWKLICDVLSGHVYKVLKNRQSSQEYNEFAHTITPFMISYWSALLRDENNFGNHSARKNPRNDLL